jgi:GTPase Era involved in 16S rRNA processing
MIRDVGTRARLAVSELLQRPAHLKLTVRIEPDWTSSPAAMAALGYRA